MVPLPTNPHERDEVRQSEIEALRSELNAVRVASAELQHLMLGKMDELIAQAHTTTHPQHHPRVVLPVQHQDSTQMSEEGEEDETYIAFHDSLIGPHPSAGRAAALRNHAEDARLRASMRQAEHQVPQFVEESRQGQDDDQVLIVKRVTRNSKGRARGKGRKGRRSTKMQRGRGSAQRREGEQENDCCGRANCGCTETIRKRKRAVARQNKPYVPSSPSIPAQRVRMVSSKRRKKKVLRPEQTSAFASPAKVRKYNKVAASPIRPPDRSTFASRQRKREIAAARKAKAAQAAIPSARRSRKASHKTRGDTRRNPRGNPSRKRPPRPRSPPPEVLSAGDDSFDIHEVAYSPPVVPEYIVKRRKSRKRRLY